MLIAKYSAVILEDVINFLRDVPPFQFLDEETLRQVSSNISVEFYPKGHIILEQEGPASEYLRIIKKGGVKVTVKSGGGNDSVIDFRSEGDAFGFLSLVSGDKSRANVVAIDDTITYLLDKKTVTKLLDTHPAFGEYYFTSFFGKYIDKSQNAAKGRGLMYGGGDRLLFATPVGEVATREVVTASQEISIRDAAQMMSMRRISCLVLTDAAGVPTGLITDRDLRDKVVSRGRSVTDSAGNIMSVSLIKADAKEYCFEALLKMIRHNIHHLLVVDEGRLTGIITNHDMMVLQGTSPISVAKEIEGQQTVEGLIPVSAKINHLVGLLLKEGAKASNITRILTEINDRLAKKIIEITEKRFGLPPIDYCWIIFGSEGRKEQTFKTDQDNAIILGDAPSDKEADAARRYFDAFAGAVSDSLQKVGFPSCAARYMASNEQWRQPLRVWKRYFSGWINEPTADAVLKSLIFYDLRPLYGNFALADELRSYTISLAGQQKLFLGMMAGTILRNAPPLGFFKSFVVEKGGEHKDELDLKVKGIALYVDVVRLFALERGVSETSTLDRISALREKHAIVGEYAEELEHAFEFLMLLRIQHQYDQISSGLKPDNFINPNKLNNLEKKMLREAFTLVSKMQGHVMERYKQMVL